MILNQLVWNAFRCNWIAGLLGKKVDLVSARGLSKYIQPVIEKEKQLIYVRSDE